MPALPINLGRFDAEGAGFRPNGPIRRHGPVAKRNPIEEALKGSGGVYAARIMVGFNVSDTPTWTMDDLVEVAFRFRKQQTGAPEATFFTTLGLYHDQARGVDVPEAGGQILIIRTSYSGETIEKFINNMVVLAEEIAGAMEQNSVLLEIQKNGITYQDWRVVP